MFEYALRLDVEGKTVLAALGPLAAPRPTEGIPDRRGADRRGADRRRADALVELVRRAVACPDGVPTAAKAQLFLTVDMDDLIARVGAATTIGSADSGTLLAPETVRRIGCDAGLLPRHGGTRTRPGPRPRNSLVHPCPNEGPVAAGPALHDSRLRNARAMVRRTPHPPLRRRRPYGSGQRHSAVRIPPPVGPRPPAHRQYRP
jgi:hypothetical protein